MTGAERHLGKGNELSGKEEGAVDQREQQRLSEVTGRIVMDEEAGRRVLEGIKARKYRRKRLAVRVPAAAAAVCLVLFVLWLGTPALTGDELVVYAATEEYGWQRLEEGERILLKMEPFQTVGEGEDIEAFDAYGHPYYYPYICTFRVEVPEDYLYDRQMVMIRDDHIMWEGDKLVWWVAPERPEDEDKVRQGAFRLWIVSDKMVKSMRERVGAYEVELTKEDGKCYAELKRVWKKWEE
ncbi:MAG: hypothetical protein K2O15_12785 [Lachnospiraceae bacterium]|nr:hypothetical protein [Lachnospiraceae bacterium]